MTIIDRTFKLAAAIEVEGTDLAKGPEGSGKPLLPFKVFKQGHTSVNVNAHVCDVHDHTCLKL